MRVRWLWFVLASVVLAPRANAAYVHRSGTEPQVPFEILYEAEQESPLELVLQITNTQATTLTLASWQLQLTLHPTSGAEGNLQFVPHVFAPPDSLFGEVPGPYDFLDENPAPDILCFDGTFEPTGEPIPPDVSRNIVTLPIMAGTGTHGTFELVMQLYDPETELGSAWLDAMTYLPQAFENSTPGSLPDYLLLGTIVVQESSEPLLPGDYNNDLKVSAADYTVWRDHLDSPISLPNDATPGVGPEDYQVWIDNYGAVAGGSPFSANVPEPSGGQLFVIGCAASLATGLRRRRENFPSL